MPGYRLIAKPSNIRYCYDGTLPGLYCALYAAIYAREMPISIVAERLAQPILFPERRISTDIQKARRVRRSIEDKISLRALELVETVYYSCLSEKELHILRFLLHGYAYGAAVINMLAHPAVHPLHEAAKHLWREQHLLLGFVRFSDYDGMLAASITPKNFVLPFLANHFADRFHNERFIIYDQRHKAALIHENGECFIAELDAFSLREPSEMEQGYRALWKKFYHTVAIDSRRNPKCRMTHMPKRYWANMTEMQE